MMFQELMTAIIVFAPIFAALCEGLHKPLFSLVTIVVFGIAIAIASGRGYWVLMKRINPKSSWWLLFAIAWLICSLCAVVLFAEHVAIK